MSYHPYLQKNAGSWFKRRFSSKSKSRVSHCWGSNPGRSFRNAVALTVAAGRAPVALAVAQKKQNECSKWNSRLRWVRTGSGEFVHTRVRNLPARVTLRPRLNSSWACVIVFEFSFSLFLLNTFTDAFRVLRPFLFLFLCCTNRVTGAPGMLETTDNWTWSNNLQPLELMYHSCTLQVNC